MLCRIHYGGVTWRVEYQLDEGEVVVDSIWFPDGVQNGMEWFSVETVKEFGDMVEGFCRKGNYRGGHATVCPLSPIRYGPLKGEI